MTKLRLRSKVNFPANVTADGGIAVRKESGQWVVYPKFSDLVSIAASSVQDPTTQQVWIYNPAEDTYAVLTLGGLGDALFKLTSTTSNSIGLGSKTFTVQSNKDVGVGQYVVITDDAAPSSNGMYGKVTDYTGTSLTVNVEGIYGSGTKTAWTVRISGTAGSSSGVRQVYSTTTADADPGAGTFRLNNATPASATAAYLDNLDASGATVSSIFDTWDDSTNTTKGSLFFQKTTDPTVWVSFRVTGSVIDGTGYRKLTLSSGSGSGAFTNGDTFTLTFSPAGDAGTNGDVAISGTPSVGQFAIWTNATTEKGVAITGLVKGNGASDPTAAVAGTDYAPATSGSSLLKANGSGGFATPGTGDALTIGTIEVGNASDTTISRSSAGVIAVEGVNLTPNIPVSSKSAAYTTVLSDANTAIYHPSSDNNARTFTIDSNANVAYPVGTTLTFINDINTVTIAITSDTLVFSGPNFAGSRTLSAGGMATAIKVASTRWYISGAGLS